jgi:hypothetical protein
MDLSTSSTIQSEELDPSLRDLNLLQISFPSASGCQPPQINDSSPYTSNHSDNISIYTYPSTSNYITPLATTVENSTVFKIPPLPSQTIPLRQPLLKSTQPSISNLSLEVEPDSDVDPDIDPSVLASIIDPIMHIYRLDTRLRSRQIQRRFLVEENKRKVYQSGEISIWSGGRWDSMIEERARKKRRKAKEMVLDPVVANVVGLDVEMGNHEERIDIEILKAIQPDAEVQEHQTVDQLIGVESSESRTAIAKRKGGKRKRNS